MSPLDNSTAESEAEQEQRPEPNLVDLADWMAWLQYTLKGLQLMLGGMRYGAHAMNEETFDAADYFTFHAIAIAERVSAVLDRREERRFGVLPDSP